MPPRVQCMRTGSNSPVRAQDFIAAARAVVTEGVSPRPRRLGLAVVSHAQPQRRRPCSAAAVAAAGAAPVGAAGAAGAAVVVAAAVAERFRDGMIGCGAKPVYGLCRRKWTFKSTGATTVVVVVVVVVRRTTATFVETARHQADAASGVRCECTAYLGFRCIAIRSTSVRLRLQVPCSAARLQTCMRTVRMAASSVAARASAVQLSAWLRRPLLGHGVARPRLAGRAVEG